MTARTRTLPGVAVRRTPCVRATARTRNTEERVNPLQGTVERSGIRTPPHVEPFTHIVLLQPYEVQDAAGARKGDLQAESPGGVSSEPADHALGRSRGDWTTKLHLGCEQDQNRYRSCSLRGSERTARSSLRSWTASGCHGQGVVGRALARIGCWPIGAYTSRGNRAYLRRRGIKATIPSKSYQDAHRRKRGPKGGRPRLVIPRSTSSATRSNVESTGSNAIVVWLPGSTSWLCATRPS